MRKNRRRDQTALQLVQRSSKKSAKRVSEKWLQHGARSLVKRYHANTIDRRSMIGQLVSEWEQEFATHCGYDRLSDCPITLRWKIQSAIGDKLFIMIYEPHPANKTGLRDVRAAENSLNRSLSELGLKRAEKPIQTLDQYVEAKYGGDGEDAESGTK